MFTLGRVRSEASPDGSFYDYMALAQRALGPLMTPE
jgi:hypothetical protein